MKIDKRVAILLCTYNGCKFIRKQLDSITHQTHQNWVIFVSDDGSTDGTLDIIHEYQQNYGEDKIVLLHDLIKDLPGILSLRLRAVVMPLITMPSAIKMTSG
jgi:glycosyltransferase involved in cell wall biosynthesis